MKTTNCLICPNLNQGQAALITKVKAKQGNLLQFVAMHLDHQEINTDRIMQAKALAEILTDSEYPTLLVGNLNTEPNNEPVKILLKEFTKPDTEMPICPLGSPKPCGCHVCIYTPRAATIRR